MLELKAEPENMEVMGYVRSSTVLKTEFIACVNTKQKNQVTVCVSQKLLSGADSDGNEQTPSL